MPSSSPDHPYFDEILQHLQQTRGFDFTAYKRTSLMRRLLKRIQAIDVPTLEAYLDYLQVHPEEFGPLFNAILINVTSFFRDREVWDYVAADVLPTLLKSGSGSVRVWSAGCASGQEPFTLAMLFAEAIGEDQALRERVKIYATDVDEEALGEARGATYDARQVADVAPALLEKYFDRAGSQYVFNRDLRRAVIFGRHDLLQDAPISRVDLLVCRNTLMYFSTEAQARILGRFYFSLAPSGYVVLGRAEMLFSHAAMFAPVDLKRRVFRAVSKPNHQDRLLMFAQAGRDIMAANHSPHVRLRDAAFESDVLPQLVLDATGTLVAVNAPARERFGLTTRDLGRPLQDLEVAYRPAELRAAVQRTLDEQRATMLRDVPWVVGTERRLLQIAVGPLFDTDRSLIGARLSFQDITEHKGLQTELQHSRQELETAYEELQSTNEELETTNEELQSTVEELETTNEELQSTNEELETMNEELQSTNEELQTMNDELQNRGAELNLANGLLESVFTSLRSAVVVIDREYRVLVWNNRASDLWGLRSEEAQRANLLSLDIGLPVAELRQAVRDVLSGATPLHEVDLPATSRRGKSIECRITMSPLRQVDGPAGGVILLMEERMGAAQQ